MTDTSSFLYDGNGKLSDNTRLLFNALESTNSKCNYTYILDPTLIRSDLGTEFSIATKIDQSSVGDNSNPNRVIKLVKKNLDEMQVESSFLKQNAVVKNTDSLYNNFLMSKTAKDSVLVFYDKTIIDSVTLNGRRYKVLTNIEDVRNNILLILCKNEKASLSLLINPPIIATPTINTLVVGAKPEVPVKPTRVNTNVYSSLKNKRATNKDNGDLSMIKDSEGCDVCTRYYSATDKLGRTRQITEKNSTFCCPCGKTIEMKGRTYRMECDGPGSNRLALVQ